MNLSEHFTLAELTVSESAVRLGIKNTPSPAVVDNLRRLAAFLERVRVAVLGPVLVLSGYRSRELNQHVGGSVTSAHMRGLAADIIVPGRTPSEVCRVIMVASLEFDQMIHEYASWCHVAIPAIGKPARNDVLTICRDGKGYQRGLLPCPGVNRKRSQ